MTTLIIYDSTGYIYNQIQGSYRTPIGLTCLEVEIPQGQQAVSVDVTVTPNVPVFADLPKSETQILQEQVNNLNIALAALMGGAK